MTGEVLIGISAKSPTPDLVPASMARQRLCGGCRTFSGSGRWQKCKSCSVLILSASRSSYLLIEWQSGSRRIQ